MNFGVYHIGATYKTVCLENLGKIQWAERAMTDAFLLNIAEEFGIDECFFLGSCNRREFYFYAPELYCSPQEFFHKFAKRLSASLGYQIDRDWLVFRQDAEALSHLFRVTSALDSMVLGETEIIRQIKDQFEASIEAGLCGKYMRAIVEQALRASKKVRSSTRLTRNVISMPSLIYRGAIQFLTPRKHKRIVVVGAGQFVESILTPFGKEEDLELTFVNRTYTQKFSDQYGGRSMSLSDFLSNPPDFDVLISATGSHTVLFTRSWLERYSEGHNIFLVDCALPCDIDPEAANMPNAHLLGLREMETTLARNREQRSAEIPKAEPIFKEALVELQAKFWEYGLAGIHGCISQHYRFVGEKALVSLNKQLPHLKDGEREVLEQWTRRLVSRLVNVPALGLKGVARELGDDGVDAWCREISDGAGVFFEGEKASA